MSDTLTFLSSHFLLLVCAKVMNWETWGLLEVGGDFI